MEYCNMYNTEFICFNSFIMYNLVFVLSCLSIPLSKNNLFHRALATPYGRICVSQLK